MKRPGARNAAGEVMIRMVLSARHADVIASGTTRVHPMRGFHNLSLCESVYAGSGRTNQQSKLVETARS
jgi:hypothetical protein